MLRANWQWLEPIPGTVCISQADSSAEKSFLSEKAQGLADGLAGWDAFGESELMMCYVSLLWG